MRICRSQGRVFVAALPQITVAANMARRVLKLIREEHDQLRTAAAHQIADDSQASLSLHKLVTQNSENQPLPDYSKPLAGLRAALLDHLEEIEMELETNAENVAAQAAEHIHSSELILTLGHSRTVERFLKSAAKRRKFEVVVAECAPGCRVSVCCCISISSLILSRNFVGAGPQFSGRLGEGPHRDHRHRGLGDFRDDVARQ